MSTRGDDASLKHLIIPLVCIFSIYLIYGSHSKKVPQGPTVLPSLSGALLSAIEQKNLVIVRMYIAKGAVLVAGDVAEMCLSINLNDQAELLNEVERAIPSGLGFDLSQAVVNAVTSKQTKLVKILSQKGALLNSISISKIFKNFARQPWNEPMMHYVLKCIPADSQALNWVLTFPFSDDGASQLINWTPLAIALTLNASDEIISALITKGCNPNLVYADITFPPSWISQPRPHRTTAMHKVLSRATSKDKNEYYPFHKGSLTPEDLVRIFKVLVAHGAKCDVHDGEGKSVAEFASELNSAELVEVMLSSIK